MCEVDSHKYYVPVSGLRIYCVGCRGHVPYSSMEEGCALIRGLSDRQLFRLNKIVSPYYGMEDGHIVTCDPGPVCADCVQRMTE